MFMLLIGNVKSAGHVAGFQAIQHLDCPYPSICAGSLLASNAAKQLDEAGVICACHSAQSTTRYSSFLHVSGFLFIYPTASFPLCCLMRLGYFATVTIADIAVHLLFFLCSP